MKFLAGIAVLISVTVTSAQNANFPYTVGVGIADMTGPPADINFMGYAELSQSGTGIHTRQFARAFIFDRDGTRVVYVVADVLAVGIAVRREVVNRLQLLFGDVYTLRNVIVAGTHTHGGPGGHLVDFILDVSIMGFSTETFEAYVTGVYESIVRAHYNMKPARLLYAEEDVEDAGINRSQFSYDHNPAEERQRFPKSIDTTLSQVRIEGEGGSLLGVLNWFPVHTTSMNNTNQLITSDNLGFATLQLEKTLNGGALAGEAEIIAAFAPSNMGDVSPNTRGPRCELSGLECDNQFLLCDAMELCFASGPGNDMFESTKIIGGRVYEGALRALSRPGEVLNEGLSVVHQFVNLTEEVGSRYDPVLRKFVSEQIQGCSPALGFSFASGTTDGANTLNITQGTLEGVPLLEDLASLVAEPTAEDILCHEPKPILLATGRTTFPFEWHQHIHSISLINLGGLYIAGVPGEPTTMSGRRIRDVIGQVLEGRGRAPRVVVSGLVNEYIHYVATYEEYQIQRYEAASTIFGPHTLELFLNKYDEFTRVILDDGAVPAGPLPLDNMDRVISLIPRVIVDTSPAGRNFGDVLIQPPATIRRGNTVSANFVAASPRNNIRHDDSYLLVEKLRGTQWVVVARDADWDTKFIWDRTFVLLANSRVTIEWDIPQDQTPGSYRIRYFGASRSITNRITEFEGQTNIFQVTA